jgi:choline dehydrogenase-like flavoprotein
LTSATASVRVAISCGMVWARGHENDFDHWIKEAGDDAWNYRHVLDI